MPLSLFVLFLFGFYLRPWCGYVLFYRRQKVGGEARWLAWWKHSTLRAATRAELAGLVLPVRVKLTVKCTPPS